MLGVLEVVLGVGGGGAWWGGRGVGVVGCWGGGGGDNRMPVLVKDSDQENT